MSENIESKTKVCISCEKDLIKSFFQSPTDEKCVFCKDRDEGVVLVELVKNEDYEEVEDTGCAGGACTL